MGDDDQTGTDFTGLTDQGATQSDDHLIKRLLRTVSLINGCALVHCETMCKPYRGLLAFGDLYRYSGVLCPSSVNSFSHQMINGRIK